MGMYFDILTHDVASILKNNTISCKNSGFYADGMVK
jgi:hypothetical protein